MAEMVTGTPRKGVAWKSLVACALGVFVSAVFPLRTGALRVCTSCDADVSTDYLSGVVHPLLTDFFYNYDGIEFARKVGGAVRLLFHDSATYSATADNGEPNGCLEMDDPGNGGLGPVTAALSAIYASMEKRDDFSRADFWQYAGLVATDVGFARTIADGEITSTVLESYNGTATTNFRFGRIDTTNCNASGFWNASTESVEFDRLPIANGDFAHIFGIFVTRMGMSLRELVAMVGAHTLGAATPDGSGNDGIWVERNDVLDNQFYIDLLDMDWEREVTYFGVDDSSSTFQWVSDTDDGVELMMLNTDISLVYQVDPATAAITDTCTESLECAYNLADDELSSRLFVEEFAGGARGTTRNSTTKLAGMVAWYKTLVPAFIHMGELGYEDSLLEPCVVAAECTGGVVDNSSYVHTQLTILIDDTYRSSYHSTLAFRSVIITNLAEALDMNSSRISIDGVRSGSVIVQASLYLDPIDDARQILVLRDDDTTLRILQGAFATEISAGVLGDILLVRSERISAPNSARTSASAIPSEVTEDLRGPFQAPSISVTNTLIGSTMTGVFIVLVTSVYFCLHWTRISDPDSYSLMFADEAKDSLFLNSLRNYCYDIVGNMCIELEKEFPELDNAENVEPFHVFCILASEFISELADFTDRRLHLARKGSLDKTEVYQVIGAFLYCQLVGLNLKVSMEMFDAYLKRTSNVVEHMRDFEENLFVKTRQIATSKHQHVVVDDKLVGTRSSGVQRRKESNRKAGKDGFKSDTVADALLRIMLATQHCGEENYTQPQAVNALLKEYWFVLRLFTITATSSGAIISQDENVIRYLQKEGLEDPDISLPAGFTDADSTTDNAGTTRIDDFDDDFDDDVDDGGARAAAIADEDDESDLDTTCSGPGSQAGTASENPDNEAYSAVANADADADEMERAKCELMKSWFFTRGSVTKAMKSGTINEKNLFKALQRQSWCIELYDVGLLANAKHPYITASCDGIGLIRLPCEANSISPVSVLAAIEFKTRSGVETLDRARKVSTEHGTYFQCTVQDEVWWDAVPKANRAQVLHQAVVLDTDYVLFVEGSTMEIIYSCLVCVPATVRSSYLTALLRHKRLLEWAYEAPSDGTSLPKPPLELFSVVDCSIIASHMRLWRAVRTKVIADGKPLPPIRIFKCLAQCAYNYMKGGSDRHTQFVAAITNTGSFKLNFEQKICLRGVLQLAANSFTLYRVFRACTTPDFTFKFPYNSILEFRTACNMISDLRTEFQALFGKRVTPGAHASGPLAASASDVDLRVVFLVDVWSLTNWGPDALFESLCLLQEGHQLRSRNLVWGYRLYDARQSTGCTPRELDRALRQPVRSTQFFRSWNEDQRSKLLVTLRKDASRVRNASVERTATTSAQALGSSSPSYLSIFQSSVAEMLVDFNWDDTESQLPGQDIASFLYVVAPTPVQCPTAYREFTIRPNALDFLQKFRQSRAVRLAWVDTSCSGTNSKGDESCPSCAEPAAHDSAANTKLDAKDGTAEELFRRRAFELTLRRVEGCVFPLSAPAAAVSLTGIPNVGLDAFLRVQWALPARVKRRSRPVSPQLSTTAPSTLPPSVAIPGDLSGWEGPLVLPETVGSIDVKFLGEGKICAPGTCGVRLNGALFLSTGPGGISCVNEKNKNDSEGHLDAVGQFDSCSGPLCGADYNGRAWLLGSENPTFARLLTGLRASGKSLLCAGPLGLHIVVDPLQSGDLALASLLTSREASLVNELLDLAEQPSLGESLDWISRTNVETYNILQDGLTLRRLPAARSLPGPLTSTGGAAPSLFDFRRNFADFMAAPSPQKVRPVVKRVDTVAAATTMAAPASALLSSSYHQGQQSQCEENMTENRAPVEKDVDTHEGAASSFCPGVVQLLTRYAKRKPKKDPLPKARLKQICKHLSEARFDSGTRFAVNMEEVILGPFQEKLPATIAQLRAYFDLTDEDGFGTDSNDDEVAEVTSPENAGAAEQGPSCAIAADGRGAAKTVVESAEALQIQQQGSKLLPRTTSDVANPFKVNLVSQRNLVSAGKLTVQKRRFALTHFSGAMSNPARLLKQRRVPRVAKPVPMLAPDFVMAMTTVESSRQVAKSTPHNAIVGATPCKRNARDTAIEASPGLVVSENVLHGGIVGATPSKSAFESPPEKKTPPRRSKKRLFGSPGVIEASPVPSRRAVIGIGAVP
ncbi:Cytochrome c peroxidase, mitochondrial [Hondaea fermentalgiana]|uniref:Cytochrome c peroxidase, mitochondrial n=1 Tax=Hondaea fermentalgiana TaxID=2315210 RepID=A0A2R5G5T4_9STRA|nr:Cytochrome c peroxidase, mitochondrial [Hondaea fermentalgiana]|eukprot:GBG26396.1 Cytochrome c peroxidase, mitochondrial [Hondaea fermentalgiana]